MAWKSPLKDERRNSYRFPDTHERLFKHRGLYLLEGLKMTLDDDPEDVQPYPPGALRTWTYPEARSPEYGGCYHDIVTVYSEDWPPYYR